MAAGRQAINRARENILQGNSFLVETTLSSKGVYQRLVDSARQKGFSVKLAHISTEDPQINIARVADRLSKGGHEQEVSVTHAACWAHGLSAQAGRRALEKALTMEPESTQQGLDDIAALYAIERKLHRGTCDAPARPAYRQQYSEPIVNDFFSWVYDQRQRVDVLPSNPLSKGLHYISERQRDSLSV